jgi:hypothetical protein
MQTPNIQIFGLGFSLRFFLNTRLIYASKACLLKRNLTTTLRKNNHKNESCYQKSRLIINPAEGELAHQAIQAGLAHQPYKT